MTDRRTPLVAVAVIAVLLSGSIAPAVGQTDLRTVDGNTKLATDDAAAEFQSSGSVAATIAPIQLDVSVHKSAADANASGLHVDPMQTFIRVDYAEDVPRTVRLHIDEGIISPRPKQALEPAGENSNASADLAVAEDGTVQSVTLHLRGETHAVFTTNNAAGFVTGVRRSATGYVDQFARNVTGIGLPTLGGGEWERVPSGDLSGTNVSYAIPPDDQHNTMTIQYQAGNESWYSVPECSSDAPVCTLERGNKTLVVSTSSDAPPVRYKYGTDILAGVRSAIDDASNIPGNAWDWAESVVGGG